MLGYFKIGISGAVIGGGIFLLSSYLNNDWYNRGLSDAARPGYMVGGEEGRIYEYLINRGDDIDDAMEIPPLVKDFREPKTYIVTVTLNGKVVSSNVSEISTAYGREDAKQIAYRMVHAEMGPIGYQCAVEEK